MVLVGQLFKKPFVSSGEFIALPLQGIRDSEPVPLEVVKLAGMSNRLAQLALVLALSSFWAGCSPRKNEGGGFQLQPLETIYSGTGVFSQLVVDDKRQLLLDSIAQVVRDLDFLTGKEQRSLANLKTHYPYSHTIFPPAFTPPTFSWSDSSTQSDFWLIEGTSEDGHLFHTVTLSPILPPPVIDSSAIPTDAPMEIPDPNRFKNWIPPEQIWSLMQKASREKWLTLRISGFHRDQPFSPLSQGKFVFKTSNDSVTSPIFYRDVPIMPTKNETGRIQPLTSTAEGLIKWSLRDVTRPDNRTIIPSLPTCANCHSFSRDGSTMGMDLDGPQSDKGGYGLAKVAREMDIGRKDIFSWNHDFKTKPKGSKTIGFLSQVSPEGDYVITTVNEAVYINNFLNHRYIQVFYPTRGVLAYYSKRTGKIQTLPGADDSSFVHCNPTWSPDGKYLVFSRARAKDPYAPGQPDPKFPNDSNETQIQYNLYRIPFNGGRGGKAEPITGASYNGMSNTFPKISPDGRFIVYVQCRNGQLLRPDGKLWIVPIEGGEARLMNCNTPEMNSWHSFSPDGRWMVFSSKGFSHYTQMFLTHINEDGEDSPPVLIPNATAANRAVNLPEFVNIGYDDLYKIDVSGVNHLQYMQDARELLERNNPIDAQARMRQALKEELEDMKFRSEVQLLLGWLHTNVDSGLALTREAIRSDPKNSVAHYNLGVFHEGQQKITQAVRSYQDCLELDPDNYWAMARLSRIYMQEDAPGIRDYEKAIEWAEKANRTSKYREPSILKTLARAYSESRRFREAIETASVGLNLAIQAGLQNEIVELEHEIQRYQANRPFSSVVEPLRPGRPK